MAKPSIPEGIQEEYYQISDAILSSFPKYRPPLDLFLFNEKISQLVPYIKKGQRLTNEQIEKIHQLCAEGELFVSRSDHPVYAKHIVKQLDLILVDDHLKDAEAIDICLQALDAKLNQFFDQPVKPVFELLYADIMVFTEYLWGDLHRIKMLLRRLHTGEYSLVRHCINTMCIGSWLYWDSSKEQIKRTDFDQAIIALLLHDVGMVKVPVFITQKTTSLKPEEREKILPHPMTGYKILHKLDLTHDFIRQAVMEHHERLDGSGYPQRTGDLGRLGKIAAFADSLSAMIQKRPYADAKPLLDATKELASDTAHYDSVYAGTFLAALVSNAFGSMA